MRRRFFAAGGVRRIRCRDTRPSQRRSTRLVSFDILRVVFFSIENFMAVMNRPESLFSKKDFGFQFLQFHKFQDLYLEPTPLLIGRIRVSDGQNRSRYISLPQSNEPLQSKYVLYILGKNKIQQKSWRQFLETEVIFAAVDPNPLNSTADQVLQEIQELHISISFILPLDRFFQGIKPLCKKKCRRRWCSGLWRCSFA